MALHLDSLWNNFEANLKMAYSGIFIWLLSVFIGLSLVWEIPSFSKPPSNNLNSYMAIYGVYDVAK